MKVPKELLLLLADGNIHSGNALGDTLGISRAAVYKQVKKLVDIGLPVIATRGIGYQLVGLLDLLNEKKIRTGLNSKAKELIADIEVLWSVDSTNSYCLAKIKDNSLLGHVCLAEYQHAGRGRRGRIWQSPFGGSFCMSTTWQFSGGVEILEGFSLAVAIAVVDALREEFFMENVKLKWPNDILCEGKKLGGILIEMVGEAGGPCSVVVGLGINVDLKNSVVTGITQPWTDLISAAGVQIDRNKLTAAILNHLLPLLENYAQSGFSAFKKKWLEYDEYLGREVVVQQGVSEFLQGISRGVSDSGELLLDINGCIKVLKSGEVSLRCA